MGIFDWISSLNNTNNTTRKTLANTNVIGSLGGSMALDESGGFIGSPQYSKQINRNVVMPGLQNLAGDVKGDIQSLRSLENPFVQARVRPTQEAFDRTLASTKMGLSERGVKGTLANNEMTRITDVGSKAVADQGAQAEMEALNAIFQDQQFLNNIYSSIQGVGESDFKQAMMELELGLGAQAVRLGSATGSEVTKGGNLTDGLGTIGNIGGALDSLFSGGSAATTAASSLFGGGSSSDSLLSSLTDGTTSVSDWVSNLFGGGSSISSFPGASLAMSGATGAAGASGGLAGLGGLAGASSFTGAATPGAFATPFIEGLAGLGGAGGAPAALPGLGGAAPAAGGLLAGSPALAAAIGGSAALVLPAFGMYSIGKSDEKDVKAMAPAIQSLTSAPKSTADFGQGPIEGKWLTHQGQQYFMPWERNGSLTGSDPVNLEVGNGFAIYGIFDKNGVPGSLHHSGFTSSAKAAAVESGPTVTPPGASAPIQVGKLITAKQNNIPVKNVAPAKVSGPVGGGGGDAAWRPPKIKSGEQYVGADGNIYTHDTFDGGD